MKSIKAIIESIIGTKQERKVKRIYRKIEAWKRRKNVAGRYHDDIGYFASMERLAYWRKELREVQREDKT